MHKWILIDENKTFPKFYVVQPGFVTDGYGFLYEYTFKKSVLIFYMFGHCRKCTHAHTHIYIYVLYIYFHCVYSAFLEPPCDIMLRLHGGEK